MMIILRPGTTEDKIAQLDEFVRKTGVEVQRIQGQDTTILGLSGDTSRIDPGMFDIFECVVNTHKSIRFRIQIHCSPMWYVKHFTDVWRFLIVSIQY